MLWNLLRCFIFFLAWNWKFPPTIVGKHWRWPSVAFVPRGVPALRLSLVLDYTLLATSDSSPCTSSRPFVTNYTSLGFHLAENAAFVSPSGSTRRLGCSQTGSCRFVTRASLTKCGFVTPIFYNFNLSCITVPWWKPWNSLEVNVNTATLVFIRC